MTMTPKGLGVSGRSLWRSVVEEFELDRHKALVLLQARRTIDRLDRLEVEAASGTVTVVNHRGDQVANPAMVEARQQSLTLARLLVALRMPSGEQVGRPQRRGAPRAPYGVVIRGKLRATS
jgi:hypothetical protein